MKNLLKKITSALVALMIVLGALPAIRFNINKNNARAIEPSAVTSYGAQLQGKEVDFYNAIASMYVNNKLLNNGSYDLIAGGVVSTGDVAEYAQGNSVLISAFNNAKDAYMLDHPELFYVDFEKLSISIGTKGGEYVATIDSGKFSDYLNSNYTTATAAIGVQRLAGENGYLKFMPTNAADTKDKVVQVARNIANLIVPSSNEANNDVYQATNGLATAEGYAKIFKYCMDKLNIYCFVVKGFHSGEVFDTPTRHYYNYVQIDGKWLAVDTYLNDMSSTEDFLLVRAEKLTRHVAQNTTYGTKEFELPTVESFRIEKKYTKNNMFVNVLYNGMNATQLLHYQELYIVQILAEHSNSVSAKALFEDTMQSAYVAVDYNLATMTYAITATAPDEFANGHYEELSKDDIILMETFENEVRFADIVRPVASKIEIGVVGEAESEEYNADDAISGNAFVHVVLNYDNNLKKMGSAVSVVAKVNGIDASTVSVVENVVWDANSPKVVEFDFKPSMLYANGDVIFSFELDGLVSAGINNDDTLARPAYIKVDYSDRKFDFASQNTNVWKQYETPYLESGFSLSNIVLKDSVLQTVDAKNENLMLVSTAIDKAIQNKIAVQGAEEYFYGLKFVADGKMVRLAEGYVNVVFPFENNKQYSDLKDKDIKVFVYDENGENEQEVDAIVTKYGIVASISQMGNFKVVYGADKTATSKKVYIKLDNGFGDVSLEIESSYIVETNNDLMVNIAPFTGYDIEYVILNGQNISGMVSNKKLILAKNELKTDNVVQIAFMSSQRKLVLAQNNYESLDDEFAANQQLEFVAEEIPEPEPEPKSKTGLLLIIIGVWIAVCGGVVVVIVLVKKKSKTTKTIDESILDADNGGIEDVDDDDEKPIQ